MKKFEIVFFTSSLPSPISEALIQHGVEVFETLAISEVLNLCEIRPIRVVLIDSSIEVERAKVIRERFPTMNLKAETTATDVIWELSHFHGTTTIH